MENFKHYAILKRIAIASTLFQLITIFTLWFFQLKEFMVGILLICSIIYLGILLYILYVVGNYGKTLFKKPLLATVGILFSLPLVFGIFVAGRMYSQKQYEYRFLAVTTKAIKR